MERLNFYQKAIIKIQNERMARDFDYYANRTRITKHDRYDRPIREHK